ncbi:histidinol-phosphate transaminase [Hymenobacter ginsengisoli]|uniref:Histidinol-phosphate aminotransferase n=1 Tax=Hymenobacter ginsengisoli TaxID=1051626 RepID=A0ABP8Q9M2_9BACT|nr:MULTISPECIES: histidinol-phosphate transaminase [unclassified Hymenobacter]MBO2030762.1 histidinol-phosphate transaminase [Hymenobacter sp. BT559]
MSFDLDSLIRPNVRVMKPYSSARDEFQGDARVMLDANENSLGSAGPAEFNRYPDPHQHAVKQALAPLKGVKPEQVFLSNGSDEVIDLLVRLVARPGQDSILSTPPTFGMYEVAAALNDVALERVPLDADFQLSEAAIAQIIASKAKIVFLCSPNNPTGNLLRPAAIEQILRGFPGLVVVDEAYADFADQPSWITRLPEFDNLVVLQTFSKAWGLAGIRLGMAFGSPEVMAYLNRIKMPYNVSENTQRLALAALADTGRFEAMRQDLLQGRDTLRVALAALPIVDHIFPSDANFLLTRFVPDAGAVYQHLLNQGIVVRRPSQAACAGTLRLTVGSAAENDALVAALREFSPAG